MSVLTDFLPIILFFIFFKTHGIYVATGVLIAASVVKLCVSYARTKKVEKKELITVGAILLFGGFTLVMQDEAYIKMKPTAINFIFAVILIVGSFTQKNFIERILGDKLTGLPSDVFNKLNVLWIIFFLIVGALNYYVALQYTTETWVNFKLFGLMGFTFLFVIIQTLYIAWYSKKHNIEFGKAEE